MTFLLFVTALSLSVTAAFYAVSGLVAIFAAAVIPIIIMGGLLEGAKLVVASWIYRSWHDIPILMKSYMVLALVILMMLTSMGIFGYLSKAHIEQSSMSQEQVALIKTIDGKIARSEAKIQRWTNDLSRLNSGDNVRVDNLITNEQNGLDKIYARINKEKDGLRADAKVKVDQQQLRITQAQDRRDSTIAAAEKKFKESFGGGADYEKAVADAKQQEIGVAAKAQKEILSVNNQLDKDLDAIDSKYSKDIKEIQTRIQKLRNQANNKTQNIDEKVSEIEGFIEAEQKKIDAVREEKFVYEKEYRKLEAEVGPLKYVSELIYGEQAKDHFDDAVRLVIIMIISVFDPLAVLLLIAANWQSLRNKPKKVDLPPAAPDFPDREQDHAPQVRDDLNIDENPIEPVDEIKVEVQKEWEPELYKDPEQPPAKPKLRGTIGASDLVGSKTDKFLEKATKIANAPGAKSKEFEEQDGVIIDIENLQK